MLRLSYSVSVSGMGAMQQRVNGDCSQRSLFFYPITVGKLCTRSMFLECTVSACMHQSLAGLVPESGDGA